MVDPAVAVVVAAVVAALGGTRKGHRVVVVAVVSGRTRLCAVDGARSRDVTITVEVARRVNAADDGVTSVEGAGVVVVAVESVVCTNGLAARRGDDCGRRGVTSLDAVTSVGVSAERVVGDAMATLGAFVAGVVGA